MAYNLSAVFALTSGFDRYGKEYWYRYVINLPHGVSMLPLHVHACEDLGFRIGLLDQYFGQACFEKFNTPLNVFLPELSKSSVAALFMVDCFGGPCGRKGVVYRDGTKIYDRFVDEDQDLPGYTLVKKHGVRRLVSHFRSKPLSKWVPNPDKRPTVADEVFTEFGVLKEKKGDDAFDQLGLGHHRCTEDWM